jgi:hypothetical protein
MMKHDQKAHNEYSETFTYIYICYYAYECLTTHTRAHKHTHKTEDCSLLGPDALSLKMKATLSFKMSGATYPAIQCAVPQLTMLLGDTRNKSRFLSHLTSMPTYLPDDVLVNILILAVH